MCLRIEDAAMQTVVCEVKTYQNINELCVKWQKGEESVSAVNISSVFKWQMLELNDGWI